MHIETFAASQQTIKNFTGNRFFVSKTPLAIKRIIKLKKTTKPLVLYRLD
jgi:hypothetical protein